MKQIDMETLGFSDYFTKEAAAFNSHFYVGRVLSQFRTVYQVICQSGELLAEVSGKFRYETEALSDFPAVGDFVLIDRTSDDKGSAVIHHVLPRKSAFIRKAAGTSNEEQVVAANIDTVFICMSLNHDFNVRRLERYLSIGWDSGATPVVVLTKSDLCDALEQRLHEAEAVALGAEILVTSSAIEDGVCALARYINERQTIAFIGSSGVGKSSLINRLIGSEQLETNGLRNDDKGRHTTTRRELIVLSNGSMVIDTPGMRELGLESVKLSKSFSDIEVLSSECKFRDCTHKNEPGCAIQAAIQAGELAAERLSSYQKLKREAKYEGLTSKQIETTKLNEMFQSVGGMKNARKFAKQKNKRN